MSLAKFLDDFFNNRAGAIQLGLPGKINKIDNGKMRADVQPLFKLKNSLDESTTLPILADIPVLFCKSGNFYIRPYYQIGDYVWLGFCTHDIDNALNGETRDASESLFSKDNACVISGFTLNNFSNSKFSKEGLLIGSDNSLLNVTETEFIFNEGTDFAVKYNALKTQFDELNNKFNALVALYNAHSGHTTGSPPTPNAVASNADLKNSKVQGVRL
jgi:hypothetical protein